MAIKPCCTCFNNDGDCKLRGDLGREDDGTWSCSFFKRAPFIEKDSDAIQGVGDSKEKGSEC